MFLLGCSCALPCFLCLATVLAGGKYPCSLACVFASSPHSRRYPVPGVRLRERERYLLTLEIYNPVGQQHRPQVPRARRHRPFLVVALDAPEHGVLERDTCQLLDGGVERVAWFDSARDTDAVEPRLGYSSGGQRSRYT